MQIKIFDWNWNLEAKPLIFRIFGFMVILFVISSILSALSAEAASLLTDVLKRCDSHLKYG